MFEKYMEESLEYRRLQLKEGVETDRLASVRQFCALFDAHKDAEHGIDPSLYPNLEDEPEAYVAIDRAHVFVLPHLVRGRLSG